MGTKVIDFQGLVNLDKKIIDQLELYLKEKENRLSQEILHLIPILPMEPLVSHLPVEEAPLKLSDAVEGFTKQVRSILQKNVQFSSDERVSEKIIRHLNSIFWDYTEALESCVIELFQQVKQVNVDKWHLSISEVIHTIQDVLTHSIDDLMWAIRRIEEPLKEFCQKYLDRHTPFWKFWMHSYLDSGLLKNLEQSQKFLKSRYEDFNQRYDEFLHLSAKVEKSLEGVRTYPVLALLDVPEQNLYVDVYRLLKLIELNPHSKGGLAHETVYSLKYLASLDSILRVFKIYYRELKDVLFNSSLEFKSLHKEREHGYFEENLQKLKDKAENYRQELQSLIGTISRYRAFILKNDSNPYVRSKWGFTEQIVAPEPVSSTKLLNLAYLAEELNEHYQSFLGALNFPAAEQEEREKFAHQEIDKLLHEMGQPLISRFMMRSRAERLLSQIKACNELGSPNTGMISYVGDVLAKAMREDWKYHVLHEFPLFHDIYRLHQGMRRSYEDPAHAFRNERFHLFFEQIEDWVKKGDLFAHIHEIELDINDMKTYLQDFLAAVQRSAKEKSTDPFLDETIEKYRQQLFEYRYIFGQFFSTIMVNSEEGQQLRTQFLFVDQYFESIEILLNELKIAWEGKAC